VTNSPLKGILLFIASFCISLGVFIQVLDYSIANVAIPHIAGELAVSNSDGTWIITFFAVGNAISMPMTGWLTDRFGSIKTIVFSVLLFTFFSWLCGVSYNFHMLVASRFFQGLVSGPLIPLSQSLMMRIFSPAKKYVGIAIWTTVAFVGPICGPIVGGWITYNYIWRWIFYINIPTGIISAVGIWILLGKHETKLIKKKLDTIGLILLTIFVCCLQICLDKGQQYDWFNSTAIKMLSTTSFVALVFLLVWSLTKKNALMEIELFKNKDFALGTIFTGITYFFIFGTIVIVPLWLQTTMGYTALWAGLAVAPMGIIPFFAVNFVSKLVTKMNPTYMLVFTYFSLAAASLYSTYIFTTQISFKYIAISRLLLGIGFSSWFPPLTMITLSCIPNHKLSNATGIFHFVRTMAGAIGTSLFVTIWQRREAFHQSNLVPSVTPYNTTSIEAYNSLHNLGIGHDASTEVLTLAVNKQAFMLASNDLFWLSSIFFITLMFLSFIFKKNRAKMQLPTNMHS
jgi:MFS transporter, DHA2 family, multidrug resistance protein